LLRGSKHIKIECCHCVFDVELIARLLRLASSGAFQVFIGMTSWVLLVRIVSSFGSQAVAGYTIGIRIILFPLLLSWGLSNAAATMVGQSLGAGKPERAESAVWRAGFYNMCFWGDIGLRFVLFARTIVGWFIDEPTVLNYGSECLRIVACGFPLYGCGQVLTQSFNGAGDTRTPTRINIFIFWLWGIPLAYLLAIYSGLTVRGVCIAMTVAFSSLAIVSALIFRRGRWKMKKI
jgi:Na+-driven multidrug efflux pump